MANLIKEVVYRTLFRLADGTLDYTSRGAEGEWLAVLQWSGKTGLKARFAEWSVVEVVCREYDDGTFTLE